MEKAVKRKNGKLIQVKSFNNGMKEKQNNMLNKLLILLTKKV